MFLWRSICKLNTLFECLNHKTYKKDISLVLISGILKYYVHVYVLDSQLAILNILI